MIERKILDEIRLLEGARGLFAASHKVEPQEWRAYIESLRLPEFHPEVLAMRYLARIEGESGAPRFPVEYVEPGGEATAAMRGSEPGLDTAKRPVMDLARNEGRVHATGRVGLVTDSPGSPASGLVFFQAVYRNDSPTATPEERRAALVGYVDLVVRIPSLFREVRTHARREEIGFRVSDAFGGDTIFLEGAISETPDFIRRDEIRLAGRTWILETFSTNCGRYAHSPYSWLVPAGGFPASLLLAGLILYLAGEEARARRSVHERTRDLRASRERLRLFEAVVRDSAGAVIITDALVDRPGPRILFVNEAFEKMTGRSMGELLGQTPRILQGPATDAKVMARLKESLRTGQAFAGEAVNYRKDGRAYCVEIRIFPVRNAAGQITHFVGLHSDVTQRNQTQEQLRLSQRLEAVGRLAAGVAHEVNNPLTYVLQNLESLIEDIPRFQGTIGDPGLLESLVVRLREASEGTARVKELVSDLKTFSRLKDEAASPVDVNHLLEKAIHIAENESRFRARLARDFGEIPATMASEGRLMQVFLNLLVNASQSFPEADPARNEIRLRTRAEGAEILVEVGDNGKGIPPEELPKIFDPFFTTKDVGEGTGLGLSISRTIVESCGGRIDVESRPGHGSLFRVRLPVRAAPTESRRVSLSEESAAALSRRRRRILVVDDEASIRSCLARILGRSHDIAVAENGREALALMEKRDDFDLILCDLMMPDVSGMNLYEAVTQRRPGLARRMLFMTGGAFTPAARAFLDRPEIRHLEKPFRAKQLEERIEETFATA